MKDLLNPDGVINEVYRADIIERTPEACRKYGTGCGYEFTEISEEDIDALRAGKILAFSDGEYTHYLIKDVNN